MGRASRRKNYVREKAGPLTRREFAWQAAGAAVAIAALPNRLPLHEAMADLSAAGRREPPTGAALPLPQEAAEAHPKLSAEALAEAEARAGEVLQRYGSKLTDEQKADVRRLAREAQAQLEALRAFPLENRDEPATIFSSVRASATRRLSAAPAAAARKPAGQGD